MKKDTFVIKVYHSQELGFGPKEDGQKHETSLALAQYAGQNLQFLQMSAKAKAKVNATPKTAKRFRKVKNNIATAKWNIKGSRREKIYTSKS